MNGNSRPLLYKDARTGEITCATIEIEGPARAQARVHEEAEYLRLAKAFLEARGGDVAWAFFGASFAWVKKSELQFRSSDV